MTVRILDGALGTWLEQRGVPMQEPAWSAQAVEEAPEQVAALHRAYADAGATEHTAATFRTTPWAVGDRADVLTRRAVALCRTSVDPGHRVWGSLAPARDCWRPQDCPPSAFEEHTAQARRLVEAGVDGLLVETFANPHEAVLATRAAAATGRVVWTALSPGPHGDLLTPEALADAARRVADEGATRVLVNCLPAEHALPWVQSLAATGRPFGVYANGGPPGACHADGTPGAARRHARLARAWIDLGAAVIGGCCGTGPEHVSQLVDMLKTPPESG